MFSPKLNRPDYRRAEREAIRMLNEAGVYEPPVNPVSIAKSVGVEVKFVNFAGASEGVSGLFDPQKNEILVNRSEPGVRQIFTIAHEIGHKVLHEEWAKSEAYRVLWRDQRQQTNDRFEQEANAFAANLLMPRQMVKQFRNLPLDRMAKIFAISESFASNRLQYLGAYGF
jgi:Zn-dependent peptidase ImmA (M78 family)